MKRLRAFALFPLFVFISAAFADPCAPIANAILKDMAGGNSVKAGATLAGAQIESLRNRYRDAQAKRRSPASLEASLATQVRDRTWLVHDGLLDSWVDSMTEYKLPIRKGLPATAIFAARLIEEASDTKGLKRLTVNNLAKDSKLVYSTSTRVTFARSADECRISEFEVRGMDFDLPEDYSFHVTAAACTAASRARVLPNSATGRQILAANARLFAGDPGLSEILTERSPASETASLRQHLNLQIAMRQKICERYGRYEALSSRKIMPDSRARSSAGAN